MTFVVTEKGKKMATNLFVPDWAQDVKISTILEIMAMFGITYETYAKSRKWFLREYQERNLS